LSFVLLINRALLTNQSGLDLIYRENGSRERELVVKKITPKSPASELQREGLKVGSVITEFDEIPVSELDEWQVLRRLSGAYGKKVIIQWQTAAGPKLSSFQLKN
jgi:C-terminal processing protease CtpA/Prc